MTSIIILNVPTRYLSDMSSKGLTQAPMNVPTNVSIGTPSDATIDISIDFPNRYPPGVTRTIKTDMPSANPVAPPRKYPQYQLRPDPGYIRCSIQIVSNKYEPSQQVWYVRTKNSVPNHNFDAQNFENNINNINPPKATVITGYPKNKLKDRKSNLF